MLHGANWVVNIFPNENFSPFVAVCMLFSAVVLSSSPSHAADKKSIV